MLKHDRPGLVSMMNVTEEGKESRIVNGSHFMITNRAIPSLDGQQVVFGEVTYGLDVLDRICKECAFAAPETSGTSQRVTIDECGRLA